MTSTIEVDLSQPWGPLCASSTPPIFPPSPWSEPVLGLLGRKTAGCTCCLGQRTGGCWLLCGCLRIYFFCIMFCATVVRCGTIVIEIKYLY